MKSLEFPNNDATQRIEQAFQLNFQTNAQEYNQLCETFRLLGGLPRTWMVKGESGSGKTYLIKALCKKYEVDYTVVITIGELAIMYPGDLLKGFKTYLNSIKNHQKVVVILDNVELIFPREDNDIALVYTFQSWIRSILECDTSAQTPSTANNATSDSRVMVLGLTQDSRWIDPSVMDLFEESIELDIPTPEERHLILQSCIVNHGIHLCDQQRESGDIVSSTTEQQPIKIIKEADPLEQVSMKCHGYIPADLDALCIQATIEAHKGGRSIDRLITKDFIEAMKSIRVSALRQSTSVQKVDPVYWSDIGGLETVKKTLEESVIWIYKHADAYSRMGISPSKGVLLYGPPGTGKTLLAKAVATESEANFMAISIPDLIKGEVGESEKAIAKIFKMANRCTPCILFLDELEAIFGTRESSGGLAKQLISQLLLEMDGCVKGVVVLAATNHPEAIDGSILRPGRLDRLVYVPPPTFEERVAILRILGKSTKYSDNIELTTIGNLSNNFTGADLKALVRKAGLIALKNNRSQIEIQDFFSASSEVQPSVNQFGLLRFEQFRR